MKNLIASVIWAWTVILAALPSLAQAQQSDASGVWIQVAARSSLLEAQDEARAFAARLPDVSGYALGGGWYGIVIGPYTRSDAEQVLQVYRAEGQIPRDSFITFAANLNTRFYPVGAETEGTASAPLLEPQTPSTETPAEAEAAAGSTTAEVPSTLPDRLRWRGWPWWWTAPMVPPRRSPARRWSASGPT